MRIVRWLTDRIADRLLVQTRVRRARLTARERDAGTFRADHSGKSGLFEENYNAATRILKLRIDERFPDSYYARLSSDRSSSYDYGQDRAVAIDTISTAIAMALRGGASVKQAAAAGAASVRICGTPTRRSDDKMGPDVLSTAIVARRSPRLSVLLMGAAKLFGAARRKSRSRTQCL